MQTVELVRGALPGRRLAAILNTHLHPDHCGGNARLQQQLGAQVWVPQGEAALARRWEEADLFHGLAGQYCPRFRVHRALQAGELIQAGGRSWELLAAPGHDPHALMLFEAEHGLLITADALWAQGAAVVMGELLGEPGGLDAAEWTLECIERLPVRRVLPGHGACFDLLVPALAQSRAVLRRWRLDPALHARHAARALLKFHLMEARREPLAATLIWACGVHLLRQLWERWGPTGTAGPGEWIQLLLDELMARGLVRRVGDEVVNL
jgi:glyoxylase-like metal-dependent hydrolase (beta-lactamase superfamily II)